MAKKNALGRGLGALISDADQTKNENISPQSSVNEVPLTSIEVNPFQPRTRFDEEALQELADSIKQLGVIQPITLREVAKDKYQIISGERRFRASKLAGLENVPAYVRKAEDDEMLAMALVENVQREDLDAIEVAISYQRLIDECKLTQEQLSERVGKKRSTVTNYLRLLKLPAEIQLGIINKDISMGHARSLINVEDPDLKVKIFTDIIEKDLSVRQTEDIIREYKNAKNKKEEEKQSNSTDIAVEMYSNLQTKLSEKFNSKIKFKRNDQGKGEIVIPFKSDEDLERIIGILDKLNEGK